MGNVLCGLPRTPGQRLRRSNLTIHYSRRRKNKAGDGEVQPDILDYPGRVENIGEPEEAKELEEPEEFEGPEAPEVQEAPEELEEQEAPEEPEDREPPEEHLGVMEDIAATCRNAILLIFPDICPKYLETLAAEHDYNHEQLITHILDQIDNGRPYPKRQRSTLKRKRSDEKNGEANAEEESRKFDNPARRQELKHANYIKTSKLLLMNTFTYVRAKDADDILMENDNCLFPAYIYLNSVMSGQQPRADFNLKKHPTKRYRHWLDDQLVHSIGNTNDPAEKNALEEFYAARCTVKAQAAKLDAEKKTEQGERDNVDRAKAEGTMADCECCYDEYPLNRMVHCDGETLHWFCCSCAKQMAETQIGLSKYQLACMSMDGCAAGFSRAQRDIFLDNKLIIALDRIEQEAVLRMAGIENLETCPFCPFAAECTPIDLNREFTCQNPECEMVSCRMCRKETHIPKSCEEAAKDAGLSARRVIEEAMSAALIRTCNKCNTPFIKENGCNKMTCTRNGCNNVQCYICHQSCAYSHFDDKNRGGKKGNCPLFDNSIEQRHEDEVRAAEELARKKFANEHPEFDVELLEVKMSDKVRQDDQQRKSKMPGRAQPPAVVGGNAVIVIDPLNAHPNHRAAPPPPPGHPQAAGAAARQNLGPVFARHINININHNHNAAGGIAPAQVPAPADYNPPPRVEAQVPQMGQPPLRYYPNEEFLRSLVPPVGHGRPERGDNAGGPGVPPPLGNRALVQHGHAVLQHMHLDPVDDHDLDVIAMRQLGQHRPDLYPGPAAAAAAPVAPHQPEPNLIATARGAGIGGNYTPAVRERLVAQLHQAAELQGYRIRVVERLRREAEALEAHIPGPDPRPAGPFTPEPPPQPHVVPPPALGWMGRRLAGLPRAEIIDLERMIYQPALPGLPGPFAPGAEARAAHRPSANPSVGRGPAGFANP